MKRSIRILAIETSCDETAAAIIGFADKNPKSDPPAGGRNPKHKRNKYPVILSNIVSSQIDLHTKTGGVVPEVASRAHMEAIIPVISEALVTAKNSKLEARNSKQIQSLNDKNSKQFETFKNSDFNIVSDFDIRISDLYSEAIKELQNIDYIAVTVGPGLIGSLLVGYNAAKTIAYALGKPIIPVNHIEGHIYSAFGGVQEWMANKTDSEKDTGNHSTIQPFNHSTTNFPILALTVSGGHTSLTLMKDHGKYETVGQTLDDAAGEAFDKVAKLLSLGYPGGPVVSRLADEYRKQISKSELLISKQIPNSKFQNNKTIKQYNNKLVFPRPIINDGTFNFSFSGLKTAVLQYVLNIKKERKLLERDKQEICAAFEDAVVDVLVTKTIRAAKKYEPKAIILAGGVAANDALRNELKLRIENCELRIDFLVPPKNLCGDNAAMIGLAAYYHIQKNNVSSWDKIKVDSNLEL